MWPLHHALGWLGLLALALGNALLREKGYGRLCTEPQAHRISSVLGAGWMLLGAWGMARLSPLPDRAAALLVGGMWLALTMAFECFMHRVLARRPWRECWGDYRVDRGRLWVLVLLAVALGPALMR